MEIEQKLRQRLFEIEYLLRLKRMQTRTFGSDAEIAKLEEEKRKIIKNLKTYYFENNNYKNGGKKK